MRNEKKAKRKGVWLPIAGAVLLLGAIVLLLQNNTVGVTQNEPTPTIGADSSAQIGLKLFRDNCTICHPNDGKTPAKGPALTGSRATRDYTILIWQVRNGKGQMPPFSYADLSDSELASIYLYLSTELSGK
jgi:mono/diheme cytochrome c family protein